MIILIILFIVLFSIEHFYSPCLDWTDENELLLWYGKDVRQWIRIF